jgi:hypothetical protein
MASAYYGQPTLGDAIGERGTGHELHHQRADRGGPASGPGSLNPVYGGDILWLSAARIRLRAETGDAFRIGGEDVGQT